MPDGEANHRRGQSQIREASLAVLVEENHQGKRRVIHDAIHETRINRIRCRDKPKLQGETIPAGLLLAMQGLSLQFGRWCQWRFWHAPEERGLLSCRISEDDVYVYVNKVGTFGLACASYWWARIAEAGIRLTPGMLGPQMPVVLFSQTTWRR